MRRIAAVLLVLTIALLIAVASRVRATPHTDGDAARPTVATTHFISESAHQQSPLDFAAELEATGTAAPVTHDSQTLVYSATGGTGFFAPGVPFQVIADDLTLATTCDCTLTEYSFKVGGGGDGTGVFTVNTALWTACPGAGGIPIVGTEATFAGLNNAGLIELTVDVTASPIAIPPTVWLRLEFDTASAGVVLGSAPEIGLSEDRFFYQPFGCAVDFGPGTYAAFYARIQCLGSMNVGEADNPSPPHQATDVAFDADLQWNQALRSPPIGSLAPKPEPLDDELAARDFSWVETLPAEQWCATFERYSTNLKGKEAERLDACPLDGACDDPVVRDAFEPDASTPMKVFRLIFHVFCRDDGTGCITNPTELKAQMATVNAVFHPWRMQFSYEVQYIWSTQYRDFAPSEETAMKAAFATSPGTKLNIYVVNNSSAFSLATFPWDPDLLGTQGGIIMHDGHFSANDNSLAHELGHSMGLWHTYHGVIEVLNCGPCYERADTDSDNTGDRCSDTRPTPRTFICAEPGGTDGCSGTPWGPSLLHNYMGVTPFTCRHEFTPQQMARAHCWSEAMLTGWMQQPCPATYDVYFGTADPPTSLICEDISGTVCDPGPLNCGTTYYWQVVTKSLGDAIPGPVWTFATRGGGDCNNNGLPDLCEILASQADDCNDNEIPDECEVPPLNPQGADCNANGVPDVCDVPPIDPSGSDCNTNGVPDSCDLAVLGDCNGNGVPDDCDVTAQTSLDCNANGVPDECEVPPLDPLGADCNANGVPDACEIPPLNPQGADCNGNGVPDACDLASAASPDCNTNGIPDECDLTSQGSADCNQNGVPDECDIGGLLSSDCNGNGMPDECEVPPLNPQGADCNVNGVPDACEIPPLDPLGADCNANGVPDACDLASAASPDCNNNGIPDECDIASANSADCNANGVPDECDLATGASLDCNGNSVPDECDIAGGTAPDCNANGVPDECDIALGTSNDCQGNAVPDECDILLGTSADCNANNRPDECDILLGTSGDCQLNGVPDECDLAGGGSSDCNLNFVPDECDIAAGLSQDCQPNGVPDECDLAFGGAADCNHNQVPDTCDIAALTSPDCNGNLMPDECEVPPLNPTGADCNANAVPDACDIASELSQDCQGNAVPDECELASGAALDCNANNIPDECDIAAETSDDCQLNGIPDECELASGASLDCQPNGVPDECDIALGTSADVNGNAVPDECDCPLAPALLAESSGACLNSADCAGAPCVGGRCYVPKNRYLTFDVAAMPAGEPIAIRVRHPASGRAWWAGNPAPHAPEVFRLVSGPDCRSWQPGPGVIQLADCGVVPANTYELQAVHCECDLDDPFSYSPPLQLSTTARPVPKHWGDTVGNASSGTWTGPNGIVNVDDVVAAVGRFQVLANAPPVSWVDLHDQIPNAIVNFVDVFHVIKAFQGEVYPFPTPLGCP